MFTDRRSWATAASAVALAACVAQAPRDASIRTVAPVIVLPLQFEAAHIGFTVFNNKYYVVDSGPYDLHRQLHDELVAAAQRNCGYQVREPAYDPWAIWNRYAQGADGSGFRYAMLWDAKDQTGPVRADLDAILRQSQVDALLVIFPAYRQVVTNTGDQAIGMGVITVPPNVMGWAHLKAEVYLTAYLYRGQSHGGEMLSTLWANADLDKLKFKDPWTSFAPDEQARITDTLHQLIPQAAHRLCAQR